MFMSYVLALEFIPKGLRSEYEPRKDVGVSELDMTGHLGLGNSTAARHNNLYLQGKSTVFGGRRCGVFLVCRFDEGVRVLKTC